MKDSSSSPTYVFDEETMELFFAVSHAQPVSRVYDPNQSIGLFEVVSPIRPDCSLAAHIPCGIQNLEVPYYGSHEQTLSVYLRGM
jgi:hypothetical protein